MLAQADMPAITRGFGCGKWSRNFRLDSLSTDNVRSTTSLRNSPATLFACRALSAAAGVAPNPRFPSVNDQATSSELATVDSVDGSDNLAAAQTAHSVSGFVCHQQYEQKEAVCMASAEAPGRVETLNGVQLYFEIHRTGEPLLLLHGFSGSNQDWTASQSVWEPQFQLIVPDLRGHGHSSILSKPFRHDEAAADMIALLDHLGVNSFKAVGVSGGGNILLHMATRQPGRVKAMVLVSATPYFPAQARRIMSQYVETLPEQQWEILRGKHSGGDAQVKALLASTKAFADTYDDMNFTPAYLSTIQARTLIVQGDRDPLYPVELSVEMARAIPQSSLCIVPNAGHGPVLGERWPEFLKTAGAFLRGLPDPAPGR
jgi:pimeloyl-ACP methyl ester carboxylesterase